MIEVFAKVQSIPTIRPSRKVERPVRKCTSKEETQDRIVTGAIALFAQRGYARTSISAIAARAHVSRSAVFWHFGDKEGLFREALRRIVMPFLEELALKVASVPPRRRVFEVLASYERIAEEYETAIRSTVRWLFESETQRTTVPETLLSLNDALVGMLRDVFFEMGTDTEESALLAAALVALLHGNLLFSILDPDPDRRVLRRARLRYLTDRVMGEGDA